MSKTGAQPTLTESNPPEPEGELQADTVPSQVEPQESSMPQPESQPTPSKSTKSPKKLILIIVIILAILGIAGTVVACVALQDKNDTSQDHPNADQDDDQSSASPLPQQISDFDLAFLNRDNASANQLYSPLSIKYALGMLKVGAANNSEQQIRSAIGSLTPQKYPNNKNMSFANALFVNDRLPDDAIKTSYTTELRNQFGAEVLRVPFTSASSINNWVKDKTFGLISDLLDDEMLAPKGGPEQTFALVNALAIDMEWVNKIQPLRENYNVYFSYINYSSYINPFELTGFTKQPFDNSTIDVNSLRIAATIHKYNLLNELGVDNIRQIITDEYTQWLGTEDAKICAEYRDEPFPSTDEYADDYLEVLGNGGYETVKSSTDFSFYDDSEIKIFAKDLKTYDGITLQYIGIMPKSTSLQDYIKTLNSDKLATTIGHLKPIALDSFPDGVITDITGNIPVFKFQDKLDLVGALQGLGITDVFSESLANLSNLSNNPTGLYIGNAVHQATVDFSNDGIKASAATALVGGYGAGGDCLYYHTFDVPVEKIDLTFSEPYLFLIRDKDSGTIWFVGTVYQPTLYK